MKRLSCTFLLPSGVECEASQLYGEHYKILTRKAKDGEDTMNNFIASLLLRVGSVTFKPQTKDEDALPTTLKFISKMRAEDKRALLANVRQATNDYNPHFEFKYKWVDDLGNNLEEPLKVTLNKDESHVTQRHIENLCKLYGDSEEKRAFYADLNKEGTFRVTPSAYIAKEYSELLESYLTILPKSKVEIQLNFLTGKGELFLANKPKESLSINTLIEARFPKYHDDSTWVNLNLDDLHGQDLEHLRSVIKFTEGSVEMELMFQDPKYPNDSTKLIKKDLIQEVAFFFPSGAVG